MNPDAEQVLTVALGLPDDDRLEVVEALIASLQPGDQPPFDESWREVIRRRSAEMRTGQVAGVPWEEVRRRARERAGGWVSLPPGGAGGVRGRPGVISIPEPSCGSKV